MAKYKRQHWLPVGYLRGFSSDQSKKNRNSKIWRFNGTISEEVKAERQCYENFHYSEEDAEAAEKSFHAMENELPVLVEKLENGEELSAKEKLLMCTQLVALNIRNAAYENRTDKSNHEAFEMGSALLLNVLFAEMPAGGTKPELAKALDTRWDVVGLYARGDVFLGSDNPSVIVCEETDSQLVICCILPVGPTLTVVAYDKRKYELATTEADLDLIGKLNATQAIVSTEYVFSASRLTEVEEKGAMASFAKRPTKEQVGWIKNDEMRPNSVGLREPLRFLREKQ